MKTSDLGADEFDALLAEKHFRTLGGKPQPSLPPQSPLPKSTNEAACLIGTNQLIEWLHISKRTAQNWRDQGKIPFIRASRRRFFYNKEQVLRAFENVGRKLTL